MTEPWRCSPASLHDYGVHYYGYSDCKVSEIHISAEHVDVYKALWMVIVSQIGCPHWKLHSFRCTHWSDCTPWTGHASYIIGSETMNFTNAEAWCQSQGYHLVSIHSEAEAVEVQTLCQSQSPQRHCWIGLTHASEGEPWEWTDGRPADYGLNADGSATANVDPWWPGVCALYITFPLFWRHHITFVAVVSIAGTIWGQRKLRPLI